MDEAAVNGSVAHASALTEQLGASAGEAVSHLSDAAQMAAARGHLGEAALLVLVLALALGAATRHLLRQTRIPYTVALLLLGLLLGVLSRANVFPETWENFNLAMGLASSFNPHLILFAFLPTLIFESAFSLDVHLFRRSFYHIFLLAVPGLLLSTACCGFIARFIFPWHWSWEAALMFGALLSATDPVAVVALLKELGASKRLGTLIEGESLLNDGTAIVIFLLFYQGVVAGGIDESLPQIGGSFAWISIGGPAVGLVIAALTVEWLRRVFNDALVEITVTVAAAYLTFYVAEEVLHVSGVLALVALGLLLAGIGRTRISPEVEGFLHRFWEMAAYLANTLIFLLVGVVIAQSATWGSWTDWLLLGCLFILIHIVRALMILLLFPLMHKSGYGLGRNESLVLWWGGLRGAVGLSLALVVAQDPRIPSEIGDKVLFLCAGIVVLTLVINGSTMRGLLQFLGMNKPSQARVGSLATAVQHLHDQAEQSVKMLKADRFLGGADWERVRGYMPDISLPAAAGDGALVDLGGEARRRLLEAEKRSYWHQFEEGLLSGHAANRLIECANIALDACGSLADRPELQRLWEMPRLLNFAITVPVVGPLARYCYFDRLTLSYDVARAVVRAQDEALVVLDSLAVSEADARVIRSEVQDNREAGLVAVRNVRAAYPEVATAIETKAAARSVLNDARAGIQHLREEGVIDGDEAGRWVDLVESRMKSLADAAPTIRLAEPRQLLREVPWLLGLDEAVFAEVLSHAKERVYSAGEIVMRQGDRGDGLYVIVRGTARVWLQIDGQEQLLDYPGPGSVLGEMAVLTDECRSASVAAETPLTAMWMGTDSLRLMMAKSEILRQHLWETGGMRFAENALMRVDPYRLWGQSAVRRWLLDGQVEHIEATPQTRQISTPAVLLSGMATNDDGNKLAPGSILRDMEVTLHGEACLWLCPPLSEHV